MLIKIYGVECFIYFFHATATVSLSTLQVARYRLQLILCNVSRAQVDIYERVTVPQARLGSVVADLQIVQVLIKIVAEGLAAGGSHV